MQFNWIDTKLEYEQRVQSAQRAARERAILVGRVRLPKLNELFKKSDSVR